MPPEGLRNAMNIPRIKLLAVALVSALWALSSTGQEEPQAPDPEAENETPPQPPRSPGNSGADDVFIPSEEIAADEEVTFPVDI